MLMKRPYFTMLLALSCLLFATTAKADLGVMYLLADHNSWSMTASGCDLLTETEEGSNVFYNEAVTFTASEYFALYSQLDTSWGLTYRYAGYSGGESITPNQASTLYNNATLGWESSFKTTTAGTYEVWVDLNYMTILLYDSSYELELPTTVYFFGTDGKWDTSAHCGELTETEEGSGIFTGTTEEVSSGYLSLVSGLAEESSDWGTLQGYRYGPATDGTKASLTEANEMTYGVNTSWTVAVGSAYYVVADFNEMTMTITAVDDEEDSSVETLSTDEQAAEGPAYSLSGQRLANPTKGIVIQDGKKLLLK